ncbi:STE24 endopeptidase [Babesia microti strain RI]|uniref:CAAX prenyl protease n=1 Tax=Babesia microti (strain RI) TaxID=1133968 RepID=I7J936_BABMR|nr:STE24 endopeptidase [Babesia microti strain RI]CCF75678.1 STE24 endopeptidase [Babesia microti strain RI]|eukprot:XP_012650086.1 STE24 endopeptidase [Babesia microti strain RI]
MFFSRSKPKYYPQIISGGFNFFLFYIVSVLFIEFFEQYLNFRQFLNIKYQLSLSTLERSKLAKGNHLIEKKLSDQSYSANLEYANDKILFQIFSSLISTIVSTLSIIYNVEPMIWNFSQSLYYSEYKASLVFVSILVIINTIVDVPFALYSDFVLEEKHGFNKKTIGLFVKDLFLSLIVQGVFGLPVMLVLIYLENTVGDKFYIYAFVFSIVFSLIMVSIYPNVIAPLFHKFTPLENQGLSSKIYALAKEKNFPLYKIFQVDASKRTGHSNAYFYGFWWCKRLVLYDTILTETDEQIVAVVAHEIGHWWCNHLVYLMSLGWVQMFSIFYFYTAYRQTDAIFKSFGFEGLRGFVVSLTLFLRIYSPISTIIAFVMKFFSRKFEHQADAYAVECGKGTDLKSALVNILSASKSLFFHDPLYSLYNYTHPTLTERCDYIDELQRTTKKGNRKDGKFE